MWPNSIWLGFTATATGWFISANRYRSQNGRVVSSSGLAIHGPAGSSLAKTTGWICFSVIYSLKSSVMLVNSQQVCLRVSNPVVRSLYHLLSIISAFGVPVNKLEQLNALPLETKHHSISSARFNIKYSKLSSFKESINIFRSIFTTTNAPPNVKKVLVNKVVNWSFRTKTVTCLYLVSGNQHSNRLQLAGTTDECCPGNKRQRKIFHHELQETGKMKLKIIYWIFLSNQPALLPPTAPTPFPLPH